MRKNTIMYLASYSSIVQTFDKCKNLLKKLAPAPVSDVEGVGTYNLFVALAVWGDLVLCLRHKAKAQTHTGFYLLIY